VVWWKTSPKGLESNTQNQNMAYMLKLYHYTDEEAFHSIKREGVIRAGTMNKYGMGVYLTDLDPEEYTREEVAKANYGVGAQRNLERGRLDHHIPIFIASYELFPTTANGYRYPDEMLRLDDYSIQNAGSNHRWAERSLQTAMVVGGGALAVTSGAVAVVSGAVAVVQLFQAANGWLSNRCDHQEQRRNELEQTLDRIVTKYSASGLHKEYATKRIGSDGVCIACQRCQAHVTDMYEGGVLWASHVDHRKVITRLSEHDQMHFIMLVAKIMGSGTFWMAVWMFTMEGETFSGNVRSWLRW
jgi:HYD1 signature containing ADP-ribosyltransferase